MKKNLHSGTGPDGQPLKPNGETAGQVVIDQDPVGLVRARYGERLREAAEDYMITLFESPQGTGEQTSFIIAAAMHILCQTAWVQPGNPEASDVHV